MSEARGKKMTAAEDLALCKAFIAGSEDSILGTGQKSAQLWAAITTNYNNQLKPPSCEVRTQRALESKWSVIKAAVAKFGGYYAQVTDLNASGSNLDDTFAAAMELYKKHTFVVNAKKEKVSKAFTFAECWEYLKTKPKWDTVLTEKRHDAEKRTAAKALAQGDASLVDAAHEYQSNCNKRPQGIKGAKRFKVEANQVHTSTKAMATASTDMALAMHRKATAAETTAHMQLFTVDFSTLSPVAERFFRMKQEEVLEELENRRARRVSAKVARNDDTTEVDEDDITETTVV